MDRSERSALVAAGVIGLVAVTRLSFVNLLLATAIVGAVALLLTVIGLSVNMRAHGVDWNRGWIALSAGLALDISHALGRPASGATSGAADLVGATAGLVTIVGLALLVEHRERGRAVEFVFEGLIVALTVGFTAWLHLEPRTAGIGTAVPLAALMPAALDLIALWMVARLVSMSRGYPVAYRLLAGSLMVMFAVDALSAGATLSVTHAVGAGLGALQFGGFVLWAMATVHPSLSDTFEPVPALETRLSTPRVVLLVAAMLTGPAALAIRWAGGSPQPGPSVVVGTTLIAIVVVAHLLRLLQARATTEYRAQHDPLTGLPNRILFQDRLDVAVTHARRTNGNVGVFFLDLDRFKTVNDSLGHDAGNRLLQEVSRRLRACLREQDTVARLGGDEFSLLVADVADVAAATTVARKVLRAFEPPFDLGESSSLHVSTSIGIAVHPDHGVEPEVLLKNADTAMYRAKERGRATYQVYTNEMSARAQVRLSLESALHGAIDRGELALQYQPQVDQRDGSIVGLEALLRWNHPKLGDVSPAAFVPLAEESGLILELGQWILATACRQAQVWRRAGVLDVPIGVNVSARQFASGALHDSVVGVLHETGLPADRLEIELTESIFHRDLEGTSELLSGLRELGVRTSIDDFGTGYSGLSYLARLPIDRLKIDRSFVQLVERPGEDAALVTAIVALAASLHMDVIAEGVETPGQARFLLDVGCRDAQGYRYSRPLRPEVLERSVEHDPATGRSWLTEPASDVDLAADRPAPVDHRLDRGRLGRVLAAICSDTDDVADLEALDVVLSELQPSSEPSSWLPSPWATRVAAGTVAGLLPVVGGAAAAGALPAPAQEVAAAILAHTGLTAPVEAGLPVASLPLEADLPVAPPVGAVPVPASGGEVGVVEPDAPQGDGARRAAVPALTVDQPSAVSPQAPDPADAVPVPEARATPSPVLPEPPDPPGAAEVAGPPAPEEAREAVPERSVDPADAHGAIDGQLPETANARAHEVAQVPGEDERPEAATDRPGTGSDAGDDDPQLDGEEVERDDAERDDAEQGRSIGASGEHRRDGAAPGVTTEPQTGPPTDVPDAATGVGSGHRP